MPWLNQTIYLLSSIWLIVINIGKLRLFVLNGPSLNTKGGVCLGAGPAFVAIVVILAGLESR